MPLPGTGAIKSRLNTGDCNAYIASLIAKANELYRGNGNVAVAKDGLDLLSKISAQGVFVTKDFLKIDGWPVAGTVSGSIAANFQLLKLPLMHSAAKEKQQPPISSRIPDRMSSPSHSYLKTRIGVRDL